MLARDYPKVLMGPDFWEYLSITATKVDQWPEWKTGTYRKRVITNNAPPQTPQDGPVVPGLPGFP